MSSLFTLPQLQDVLWVFDSTFATMTTATLGWGLVTLFCLAKSVTNKGILHNGAANWGHISAFQVRKAGSSMLLHTGDTDTSSLALVHACRMTLETVTSIRNCGSEIQ